MPPSRRGPPISWASSVRVPTPAGGTVGHLAESDALLAPRPTSELTSPRLPREELSRRVGDLARSWRGTHRRTRAVDVR